MLPILFEFYGYPVSSWHVFFCAAVLLSYLFFTKLCLVPFQRSSESCSNRLSRARNILAFALLYSSGLVGARIVGELALSNELMLSSLDPVGNMSFQGGVLGGLFGFLLLVKAGLLGQRTMGELLDAALPALILGLAVGRLGCLLNGDDYGMVYGALASRGDVLSALAFLFPPVRHSGPGDLERYATQVQESAASFALVGIAACWHALKQRQHPTTRLLPAGCVGLFLGMLSCLNRFVNEFFRGDFRGHGLVSRFSLPQEIAVALGSVAAIAFAVLLFRYKAVAGRGDFKNAGETRNV